MQAPDFLRISESVQSSTNLCMSSGDLISLSRTRADQGRFSTTCLHSDWPSQKNVADLDSLLSVHQD